jgi:hypothetical protein
MAAADRRSKLDPLTETSSEHHGWMHTHRNR